MPYLFTSESVSEGHPDKLCDRVSDTVLDLFLAQEPEARVACETFATSNRVIIGGEVRASEDKMPGIMDSIESAVRGAIADIGYEQDEFHHAHLEFQNYLHKQSTDIAMGVDSGDNKDEGAGDQGLMFGYANGLSWHPEPAELERYPNRVAFQDFPPGIFGTFHAFSERVRKLENVRLVDVTSINHIVFMRHFLA